MEISLRISPWWWVRVQLSLVVVGGVRSAGPIRQSDELAHYLVLWTLCQSILHYVGLGIHVEIFISPATIEHSMVTYNLHFTNN